MSEKRYTVGLQSKTIFDMKTELYLFNNKIICELLNAQNSLICEQQATINKLNDELELTANTKLYSRRELERKVDEQQAEIERLNKELIKAITKSIPPKKYEDIDKKHKPWKYVNTNCD